MAIFFAVPVAVAIAVTVSIAVTVVAVVVLLFLGAGSIDDHPQKGDFHQTEPFHHASHRRRRFFTGWTTRITPSTSRPMMAVSVVASVGGLSMKIWS